MISCTPNVPGTDEALLCWPWRVFCLLLSLLLDYDLYLRAGSRFSLNLQDKAENLA